MDEDGVEDMPALAELARRNTPTRIMIAGDSITHGQEGDYTWRYRLWEWLVKQNVAFDFVGPYTGVDTPLEARPPQPPQPTEIPTHPFWEDANYPGTGSHRIEWGYAEDAAKHFDADHFATSGYKVELASSVIHDRVREYSPDILLVLMGYNDLAWSCGSWVGFSCLDNDLPQTVLAHTKKFIDEARRANPSIKLAIGNVVHRTMIRDDIVRNTVSYNNMLSGSIPQLTTAESPVYLVDVASEYSCGPDRPCPGAFDGLHPSMLGEYEIARAFSKVMVEKFRIGSESLITVPNVSTLPQKDLSPPANIKAEGSPTGIKLTWDRRYGIVMYESGWREQGTTEWMVLKQPRNRTDLILSESGLRYEFRLRACYGLECTSEWSDVFTATSNRATAPPPEAIRTVAIDTGFDVSWSSPVDAKRWNITQYEIGFGVPGALFYNSTGSLGSKGSFTGLIVGGIYTIRAATWTDPEGGGLYAYGRPILVGGGVPHTPSSLNLMAVNDTSIRATWQASQGAAGYVLALHKPGGRSSSIGKDSIIAYGPLQDLSVPSLLRNQIEVCAMAVNGVLESESTCALIGQPGFEMYSDENGRSLLYPGTLFAAVFMFTTYMLWRRVRRRKGRYS
ncbi:hypothetical protein CBER1_00235 [Cercospora berteroae]|uniref:Fibronectin type-III domain-containing protein n=1 Tax=Cercospora berteroae TaxID=357750 RepID=A0A2S6CDF2_9PEZI|nr:hypothetical protein CBER1_00235 [Cercospora berteroae]